MRAVPPQVKDLAVRVASFRVPAVTPSTPSGRRLVQEWNPNDDGLDSIAHISIRELTTAVLAIEAEAGREAVEAYRLDLRTRMQTTLVNVDGQPEDYERDALAAILRLIEGEMP